MNSIGNAGIVIGEEITRGVVISIIADGICRIGDSTLIHAIVT